MKLSSRIVVYKSVQVQSKLAFVLYVRLVTRLVTLPMDYKDNKYEYWIVEVAAE